MSLTADDDYIDGIPTGGREIFTFMLGNISESHEDRTFNARYLVGSSTGVDVNSEGNGPGPFDYSIPHGDPAKEIRVSVEQFDPIIFTFENMIFQAYENCSNGNPNGVNIVKEVKFSAKFDCLYGDIRPARPNDNFVINSTNNNLLPIQIVDYTLASVSEISLENAKEGGSFISAFTLTPGQLHNDAQFGTNVNWDITDVSDGQYELRLKLKCGSNTVYSSKVSGFIDISVRLLFRKPEPVDEILNFGDQISATFTEHLGCNNLSGGNYTMFIQGDNNPLESSYGCCDNKIIIVPDQSIFNLIEKRVEVKLYNITDEARNINSDTIPWEFAVGESVTSGTTFATVSSDNNTNNTIKFIRL